MRKGDTLVGTVGDKYTDENHVAVVWDPNPRQYASTWFYRVGNRRGERGIHNIPTGMVPGARVRVTKVSQSRYTFELL